MLVAPRSAHSRTPSERCRHSISARRPPDDSRWPERSSQPASSMPAITALTCVRENASRCDRASRDGPCSQNTPSRTFSSFAVNSAQRLIAQCLLPDGLFGPMADCRATTSAMQCLTSTCFRLKCLHGEPAVRRPSVRACPPARAERGRTLELSASGAWARGWGFTTPWLRSAFVSGGPVVATGAWTPAAAAPDQRPRGCGSPPRPRAHRARRCAPTDA